MSSTSGGNPVAKRLSFKINLYFKAKSLSLQPYLREKASGPRKAEPKRLIIKIEYDEKNIPTFPPQACQQARLPRAHGFRQRPPRFGCPPSSRPQEADRFFRGPFLKSGFQQKDRGLSDDNLFLCPDGTAPSGMQAAGTPYRAPGATERSRSSGKVACRNAGKRGRPIFSGLPPIVLCGKSAMRRDGLPGWRGCLPCGGASAGTAP